MEENKIIVTVVTPSYNRAKQLPNLYKSLICQSTLDFIWLIVDDGSTDGTEDVIRDFIEEEKISIEYYKKNNGGKHTALNLAIEKAQTELFFIVDSDDYLTVDAIEVILNDWKKYKELELCGISYLRGFSSKEVIGDEFPQDYMINNFAEIRVNQHIKGDKAEVWATKHLKLLRFPVFPNEFFLVESYLWLQISQMADMLFVNKIIYITEYLKGGLTESGRRLRILCPQGGMSFSLLAMDKKYRLVDRLKNAILYVTYSKFAHKSFVDVIRNDFKCLTLCAYPLGTIVYFFWKKRYLDDKKV